MRASGMLGKQTIVYFRCCVHSIRSLSSIRFALNWTPCAFISFTLTDFTFAYFAIGQILSPVLCQTHRILLLLLLLSIWRECVRLFHAFLSILVLFIFWWCLKAIKIGAICLSQWFRFVPIFVSFSTRIALFLFLSTRLFLSRF